MPETNEVAPGAPPTTDYLAKAAQWSADLISAYRVKEAVSIHKEIMEKPDYHSWKLAGKIAVIGTLDWLDGKLSRFAARRENRETTQFGGALDELTDKAFTHGVLSALAKREYLNGNYAYSGFLALNEAIIGGRDVGVTAKRYSVRKLNVDTKAQPLGKYKTGLQNLNLALMSSPLTRGRRGKLAASALQASSTGLSVFSGFAYFKSYNEAAAKTQAAKLMPDFIEA